jgi:hypothetical protein
MILSPLAVKSESIVKNSGHFVQLLKFVNLQSIDTRDGFDVVSLFTGIPIIEDLEIISNKLHSNDTLAERSVLQAEAIAKLLDIRLGTTRFQTDGTFFQQKEPSITSR